MKKKLLFAALASAGLFASSAQAINVDLFSTNQDPLIVVNDGDAAFSQAGAAGDTSILGGFRDLYIEMIDNQDNDPTLRASVSVGLDRLAFSQDSGIKSFAEVVWDGATAYTGGGVYNVTGLGGIDLTAGGTLNAFEVETISADADWFFEIIAFTDATTWTKINFIATEVSSEGPSVKNLISFAGFENALLCGTGDGVVPGVNSIICGGTGPVDLSNLGALVVRLNVGADGGNAGGKFDIDLRLASVQAVPEPATLALVGLGLFAAGFAGRRRRQSIGS